uniref:DUF4005 domain-containing protein n=2 Tax=Mesocestoides corti TaxID=53468 RepID=A0A5K3EKA1_MESCO
MEQLRSLFYETEAQHEFMSGIVQQIVTDFERKILQDLVSQSTVPFTVLKCLDELVRTIENASYVRTNSAESSSLEESKASLGEDKCVVDETVAFEEEHMDLTPRNDSEDESNATFTDASNSSHASENSGPTSPSPHALDQDEQSPSEKECVDEDKETSQQISNKSVKQISLSKMPHFYSDRQKPGRIRVSGNPHVSPKPKSIEPTTQESRFWGSRTSKGVSFDHAGRVVSIDSMMRPRQRANRTSEVRWTVKSLKSGTKSNQM